MKALVIFVFLFETHPIYIQKSSWFWYIIQKCSHSIRNNWFCSVIPTFDLTIFILCCKDKTASFVRTLAHDMEFWALKMYILLKLCVFISNPLDFLFCVMFSSRSNSENYSCNFLKLCESTTNMMRIYVGYGHQLIELYCENWC